MKLSKRFRLFIILIVILVIVVGGIYLFSKKSGTKIIKPPVATSTDRSYFGNNFSVNYPAKYTLESVDAKSGMQEVSFTDADPSNKNHEYDTLYTVYIKPGISDNQVLEPFTKSFITSYNGGSTAAVTEKSVQVDGIAALQFSYDSTAQGLSNDVIYTTALVHNDTGYIIQQVNGNPSDYLQFITSFNFQ